MISEIRSKWSDSLTEGIILYVGALKTSQNGLNFSAEKYASKKAVWYWQIFLMRKRGLFSLLKIVIFLNTIIILSNFIDTDIPWEGALSGHIVPGVKMGCGGVSCQNLGCSHLAGYYTPVGTISVNWVCCGTYLLNAWHTRLSQSTLRFLRNRK